jgi:hypothetical protein
MQKSSVDILSKPVDFPVSKWLHLQALLSLQEIKALFQTLAPVFLFFNGKVLTREEIQDQTEAFFKSYEAYLNALSQEESIFLPPFCLTKTEKSVYAFQAGEGRFLIKPLAPVIQVREHRFLLTHDGRFSSKGFGKGSIRFGLQFSFPQLFLCEGKIVEVMKSSSENVELFRTLQRWIRDFTRPTALIFEGKKTNCTFRIGLEMKGREEGYFDLQKNRLTL